jgi:flavin reductase (NADH)/cob(II)yrinic acid a,c-diamide reductase
LRAPILRPTLASFCQLVDEHSHDTHSIFVGEVEAVHARNEESPLIYFGGKFH